MSVSRFCITTCDLVGSQHLFGRLLSLFYLLQLLTSDLARKVRDVSVSHCLLQG